MNLKIHAKRIIFALAACLFISSFAFAWKPQNRDDAVAPNDYINSIFRKKVPCEKILGPRTMTALVFGQSNSANHGQTRYTPKREVYNYYEGRCYKAADPLLGATGNGGSVWSRLGDQLINEGLYDKVLLVAVGVGGTQIRQWTPTGDLYPRVLDALASLGKHDITITHMLWHQGESDNGAHTKKDDYKKMFMDMLRDIRAHGVDAPIYVAVATRCGSMPEGFEIQQAQRELVDPRNGVFPGAFSDALISMDDRHDACHFSDAGLDKHARLWLNAIKFSGR